MPVIKSNSELFTWEPAGHTPPTRQRVDKVFTPQRIICPQCLKTLSTYKTRKRLTVHDLEVDWKVTIIIKACKDPSCSRAPKKGSKPQEEGLLVEPEVLSHEIFPYYHVTKRVIAEVGRLVHEEQLTAVELR